MNESERKATEDYEKRLNAPYMQLTNYQLSLVDNAINERDRERIWHSLQCAFTILGPYLDVSKYRLKKRILALGNITNLTNFITEANDIYRILIVMKEEIGER